MLVNGHFSDAFHHNLALRIDGRLKGNSLHLLPELLLDLCHYFLLPFLLPGVDRGKELLVASRRRWLLGHVLGLLLYLFLLFDALVLHLLL